MSGLKKTVPCLLTERIEDDFRGDGNKIDQVCFRVVVFLNFLIIWHALFIPAATRRAWRIRQRDGQMGVSVQGTEYGTRVCQF